MQLAAEIAEKGSETPEMTHCETIAYQLVSVSMDQVSSNSFLN